MEAYTESFEFPWPIIKVVLEGLSILDVPRLEIKTMEEATNFIHAYGYEPSSAEDLEIIWEHFYQAIAFIENTLSDPEHPKVPQHLRSKESVTDIRRLLLLASEPVDNPDQIWACALLRLMHVLIHLKHDPRLRYFEQVQNQVLSRLDEYLYVDSSDGAVYLGKEKTDSGIKLLFFKKKDRKDRDREIIKLLHKSSAAVEEIYDRMGFRIVTETKYDAIRALRFLLEKNIISLPNIRPGRSRNWLIDFSRLQSETERAKQYKSKHADQKKFDPQRFMRRLERRIGSRKKPREMINPYSSEHFKAIQFTCRELVKVRNPLHQSYSRVKEGLEKIHGGNQVLHEVFPRNINPYEYVFFPYEIQIMDVKSYADSIFGKSSHEEYRQKQLEAARHRIFGKNID